MTIFAALRFEGLSGWWGALWLVLVLAGGAFLFWTYRGIHQRSGRSVTWWLLGLRGLGLLFLAIMFARPAWTRAADHLDKGQVAVVLDDSRSMTLPAASGRPRYEEAKAALARIRAKLPAGTDVVLFDIAGNRIKEPPARAEGGFTDLSSALRKASRLRSRPLAGVILISDGADTTARPGSGEGEEGAVPVHTVGFARAVDLDLAVRKPADPPPVLVHNEASIVVPVAKKGAPALEATVTLRRGMEVLATKKVALGKGDVEEAVALSFKPDTAGVFQLTASVEGAAGEADLSNNAANLDLRVIKDPIRVLYVEGFLRSEYTFLVRHFMERDPDVALAARPRLVAADGPEKTLPDGVLDDKVLEKTDIVMLGDMEGGYLTAAQHARLAKWLEGKNRSLVVLGGYASFGPKGFKGTPLADLLPVVFSGDADPHTDKPFSLELTEKGKAHPAFVASSDPVQSAKLWKEAPPLEGMPLVARAKPGADVLAVNPSHLIEGKPAVAIAAQRAPGGGQVLVVCPDTTWTWSRLPRLLGQEDNLYSRFWSQAARWLVGRTLDDNRPTLVVRTERPDYAVNGKVTVTVVKQRRPGAETAGAVLDVSIADPKGDAVPGLAGKASAADPDATAYEFYPGLAGRYAVSASLKADGKTLANAGAEVLVRGADLELAQPATRPDLLRAISAATGGESVDIADAEEAAKA
ncbi:MAG: hypothetical protein K2W96_21205, partial [Gemmataceae bacterium]|nr:hypothetical protein [Gemmataceae bacterium]